MTSSPDSDKKLFGNCEVEWRINEFSIQTCKATWLIQSPEFTVNGHEETKWRMNLRSKLIKKGNFVFFSVRRSSIDSGPKYVQLNVKICYTISDVKYISVKDKLLSLTHNSNYEVCFGSIENLLSKMYQSDNLFTVVCHMIVYSNSPCKKTGECSNSGLNLLSKNMSDLYTSAQHCDTKLVICEDEILTHKAILFARNECLGSIIADEENEDAEVDEFTILKFTASDGLDSKAMRKVLAYLYTGDIRHVLEEPSFAVCYCAFFFEISEIEIHYEPDKLILQSTIDIEEYQYILFDYKFENSLFSWHRDTKESTYSLLFYPRRDSCEDYIPLFTKFFKKLMLARIEFHFVDKVVHFCTSYVVIDGDLMINMDEIFRGIKKLVSNCDTIEINQLRINLKLSADIKMSYVNEHSSASVSCVNENFYYERLSTDFESLCDFGYFADIAIDNDGNYFWVHKCILASRSCMVSDMITTNEEEEAIIVSNIRPRIVSVILTYIYSGLLLDVTDEDIVEIYKAAVMANLPHLKSTCSDWLKLSFKNNIAIRCRTLRIAEKYEDSLLMKSALNHLFERLDIFLSRNFNSFGDVSACRHCLPTS